jgi:bifunctional DNA-binding transcriptional regulator/antitoxin component of YhaV-PrlF toxin-antitoxin module
MKTTQLEVKENIDGELYFDLPYELLNRLGWAEGDDIKFVEQDGGFLIKKVKYETIELDFDKEDLLNYMTYAHNKNITFNEFCEQAIKEKLDELEKEEG